MNAVVDNDHCKSMGREPRWRRLSRLEVTFNAWQELARLIGHEHSETLQTVPTSPWWQELAGAACHAGLSGIVLEAGGQRGLTMPLEIVRRLRHQSALVAANNLRMMAELARLLEVFKRDGVPVILLKGAALNLVLYDKPGLRPMGDLDLLIRPADAARACRVLEQAGYRRGADLVRPDFFPKYHYEVEYMSQGAAPVRIDLHARPFRPLPTACSVPDDAMWRDTRRVTCGDNEAVTPGPERMLIHLAAHAAFHGNSRLLWLFDIEFYARRYGAQIDWNRMSELTARWQLTAPVLAAVREVIRYFKGSGLRNLVNSLQRQRVTACQRWTLRQAPRDATSPIRHVLIDWLGTPGIIFPTGYLVAHLLPSRAHLAESYPYRHPGWPIVASLCRAIRSIAGNLVAPARAIVGCAIRGRTRPQKPQTSRACA